MVDSESDIQKNVEDFLGSFHHFGKQLLELQKHADELGIFLGHRDLLDCPNCQLMEDVAVGGILQVYKEGDKPHDTGLRFIPLDKEDEKFRCPECGTEITLSEPNFD